jgi:hypothetical protein
MTDRLFEGTWMVTLTGADAAWPTDEYKTAKPPITNRYIYMLGHDLIPVEANITFSIHALWRAISMLF